MARPVWASSFNSFSITSATSQATNYPATRVAAILPHPVIRRWRSTSTVQQNIICDFGSSKSVAAIALFGANFQNVTVASSPDNVTYTNVTGTGQNLVQDTIDGYYKWYLACSVTARYMRIRIPAIGSNTIYDGASYYTLGSAVFANAVSTWPRDLPTPRDVTLQRSYMQSGNDIAPAGPFFITKEINTVLRNDEISQLQTMGLLGEQTPFLWFSNYSDTNASSQVYLLRYKSGMKYSRFGMHYSANVACQELT